MDAQQSTQAHLGKISLSYRLKLRLKQFLKHTIGETRLYQAIKVAYSWYTQSKRQVAGKVISEKHKAKKKVQEQAVLALFMPVTIPCTKHGPSYISGFPDATECPHCLYERLWLEYANDEHPGAFAIAVHQYQTGTIPIDRTPTQKVTHHTPGSHPILVTEQDMQEARFLLDQPEGDVTTKKPVVKKAG